MLFIVFALCGAVSCRTNPHLHRRLVSKEHNYNWDGSIVLNNKSNRIVKSGRGGSSTRILADGSAEEVTDLLVPSGVDGVATAWNDESIGVYINFTDNPDVRGSLWTPVIKGNYLCGGGSSRMNYSFSNEILYIQDRVIDTKGVFCVIGGALVIVVVATVTWPMLISMNAMIMSLLSSSVDQSRMTIRQTNVILENLNGDSSLDEDDELYSLASNIERRYLRIKNGFLNRFKVAWLAVGAGFIVLAACVASHIALVQLGLPCFFKMVKKNKCYYVDQSNLVKANDASAKAFSRKTLAAAGQRKDVAVGRYVGSGKFKCHKGRCVRAQGNDYNMRITGLNGGALSPREVRDYGRRALDTEDFQRVDITDEDEANATGTPTLEENVATGSMIFTTPCGTTWRNVMDGVRWVMKSPNVDVCRPEETTIITHEFVYRRTKCTGGKWSYQNGDWDRPNPTRAGGEVSLGAEVDDDVYALFKCGFLSAGAKHAGGRVWYETIHRDDWVYCYINRTGTVGFQRETTNGITNTVAPDYDIIEYVDVREQRPNGWYEDGDYVYAVPDDFNHGETWSLSSGDYATDDYAKEKIQKQWRWTSGNWMKRYDLKPWDTAVDDFTCYVTFELKNAERFEEFQDPCPDVEAVMYKDGRIQIKTTNKRTCKVQVKFADNTEFVTTYSIKLGMPVTIPQGASHWSCTTQTHEEDNVTLRNTGTGCTISDKAKFNRFVPKDYDGTFQTTIEYSEASDPGITTLNDLGKKLSSSLKNLLGSFDSIFDVIKVVGIAVAVVVAVIVIGVIISVIKNPKETGQLVGVVASTVAAAKGA